MKIVDHDQGEPQGKYDDRKKFRYQGKPVPAVMRENNFEWKSDAGDKQETGCKSQCLNTGSIEVFYEEKLSSVICQDLHYEIRVLKKKV